MSISTSHLFSPQTPVDSPGRSSHRVRAVSLQSPRSNDPSEQVRSQATDEAKPKKREVYRYETDWLVSSIAWQNAATESFNLALSSFRENYRNYVQLVSLRKDTYDEEIRCISTFEHLYPATKILWIPRTSSGLLNLIATTADYLRLWRVRDKSVSSDEDEGPLFRDVQVNLECLLNGNQDAKYCAPLTSFDWNEVDPSIIVTSSVNTTCAVWDISVSKIIDTTTSQVSCSPTTSFVSGKLRSQLVAHGNQVNDVSFSKLGSGKDIFVTAGSDGSVRLFDLRRLSTSTVLFEDSSSRSLSPSGTAMVRLSCSKQDPNLVSAFMIDSSDILLLDIRRPGMVVATLGNHTGNLNSMSWAPHSAHHVCSAADDNQALIWELSKLPDAIEEPLLAYKAPSKISTINWSASHTDWIAIGYENCLELLRV